MKATVLQVFIDKEGIQHNLGEAVELPDARINNLVERGIVLVAEDVAETATKKPQRKAAKNAK